MSTGKKGKQERTPRSRPRRARHSAPPFHELAIQRDRLALQNEALRKLQSELEVALDRYVDLYDSSPVASVSIDTAGIVREINAAGAAMFARSRATIIGMPFSVVVNTKDIRHFMEHLRRCKQGEERVVTSLSMRRKDGGLVPVQLTTVPSHKGTRHMSIFRMAVTDLTELRHAEEALRIANRKLEQRVRERTAQLSKINHDLLEEMKERKRLEGEILNISEKERRRIGQDLHDSICQQLSGIAMMGKTLAMRLNELNPSDAKKAEEISEFVRGSLAEVRELARGLHPVELDAHGLMAALEELCANVNSQIPCRLICEQPVQIADNTVALELYRIAQEAVANSLKHAGATSITMTLLRQQGHVILSVCDNGRGILQRGKKGMGVHIMNYRARQIGATLMLRPESGKGMEVICSLPEAKAPTRRTPPQKHEADTISPP